MAEFTLNQFRDFINSVSDDIFPSSISIKTKNINFHNPDELQKVILEIIANYPNKNENHVGPRLNGICNECKGLKYKKEIKEALQAIHVQELATMNNDGRWYLYEKADRKELQG